MRLYCMDCHKDAQDPYFVPVTVIDKEFTPVGKALGAYCRDCAIKKRLPFADLPGYEYGKK